MKVGGGGSYSSAFRTDQCGSWEDDCPLHSSRENLNYSADVITYSAREKDLGRYVSLEFIL